MLSFGFTPYFAPLARPATHVRTTTKLCHSDLSIAISKGIVLDVGRSVRLRKDGTLCSPQLESYTPQPPWNAAIAHAVLLFQDELADSIHSIYLRGSVAAGHAFLDGRSDLDFVIIINSNVQCRNLTAEMNAAFPFVRRIDVTIHDLRTPLSSSLRFVLQAYCAHLYGTDLRPSFGCIAPSPDSLVNIRNDERAVIDVPAARPWFLKRVLRGIIDCVARHSNEHARDIVPCARILSEMRPSLSSLAVRAAIAACGEAEVDEDLVHDMADWAEIELFTFRHGPHYSSKVELAPPLALQKSQWSFSRVVEDLSSVLSDALRPREKSIAPFIRDALNPVLPNAFVHIEEVNGLDVSDAFANQVHQNEPIVYRNAISSNNPTIGNTEALCDTLSMERVPVDVRLASGTQFTFCKRSFVSHDGFKAPTEVRRMLPQEFISRCRGHHEPLLYKNERVYLQSAVSGRSKLFPKTSFTSICQEERWWVCTHGAVSPLHYDAAYSALLQLTGTKRMILFSPTALELMRIYPKGHPLHRRAMVDLYRPEAVLYRDFWKRVSHLGREVVLNPGDALLFPPFWAHHTESSATDGGLCGARTLRFLFS